ncbi:flocculation protein FLO11-like [Larimichthys crocea]|uniref:flocculation protein FLO11-like n=1 Tax=Larimichthys crocea TaxID=215358 RepID=UPI000F5D655B|nr:flocculation protein FLO11-like [Larimichthys crocea]
MRAKLRKQSQEASKTPPVTTSFAKFTWKKKENVLAKEAAKVAAEFIKEDEAAVKQNPVSAEDSFAKSLAVAKEIAQKLGGQQNVPPPWGSNSANRGRIRPNLPAPAAVLRKATMMALNAQNTLLEAKPQPPTGRPWPVETMSGLVVARVEPSEAKAPPPVSQPAPLEVRPAPKVSQLAPIEAKPPEAKPLPPVLRPAPFEVKPAHPKPAPSAAKPAMIKIVSDVAAPGVPESEQTRTVFVKPPPFTTMGDGSQKSEKVKSNLAAAKAQQLFHIFYSSVGQSGASSITKPTTDAKADGSATNKSHLPTPQAQKPHAQQQPFTQSQPPTMVCTSPQLQSNKSQSPQTNPESDIQIASVWSLQSTAAPTPELLLTPSKTTSETTQPKLNHPSRSEPQSVPQNQSSTLKSESQLITQSMLKPTCQTQSQLKLTTQIQTEAQSETEPKQDTEPLSYPPSQSEAQSVPQNQSSTLKSESQLITQSKPVKPTLTTQIQTEPQSETEPKQDTEPLSYPPSQSEAQSVAQNESMTSKSESQFTPQSETAELEPNQIRYQPKLTPQIQTELQSETEPSAHPETHSVAEPEPKPGPKTRGKPFPTKRVPPAPTPVRQTRSQTRYQTRQQQQQSQSEPEPEPASGDSDSAASEPKEVDVSDPGSGLQPEDGALSEGDPQLMEITSETLGLPSNMSCLNFEYDYNFE